MAELTDQKMVYELDSGWGFDGLTFDHEFETSHIFSENSGNMIGVERLRAYGKSHGLASLVVLASGIEEDFEQAYPQTEQDLSIPVEMPPSWFPISRDVTNIVDMASRGLAIKLKIKSKQEKNLTTTEPSHILQVLVLHIRTEGAEDA